MPVSMETSFPISISCPFLCLFSGRAMAHLYERASEQKQATSILGPAHQLPRDPHPHPQDPGSMLGLVEPSLRPATLPFQLWASRILCQGLKCGPSHSRAAESFEKNSSRSSWEGSLRTVWLCGGGCCSANFSAKKPRASREPSSAL